jgi:anti-anti-sigma factor
MSAPVSRQNQTGHRTPMAGPLTAPHRVGLDLLRTSIHMSRKGRRFHALVELHGELCPATVPQLRCELDQLIDDGITDITVDLGDLRFCTSHGLDLFDHIHEQLQQRHHGTLELRIDGAPTIVERLVRIVRNNDPTFSPITAKTPHLGSDAPTERPGDRPN